MELIRELDPSIDDRPQSPFPFVTGPYDSGVFWRHRELVQRLETAESDPLEALLANVLEAASARVTCRANAAVARREAYV